MMQKVTLNDKLIWDESVDPTRVVASYEILLGKKEGGPYPTVREVGLVHKKTIKDLQIEPGIYFAVIRACDNRGSKSEFSKELSFELLYQLISSPKNFKVAL